ncbi:hypothetical protein BH11BAC6_BH11BAC6_04680 [soil metagenome]
MKQLLFFILVSLTFSACQTIDVYEHTKPFPEHAWSSKENLSFSFTITDTTSLYNIFAVIRHTDAYQFNNMWLNIITTTPGKISTTQKVNLLLGDNTKGWLGSAMDDIIEHRALLTKYPVKLKSGTYTFVMQQIMREDPLPEVMNAGIRVEKAIQ